MGEALFDPVGHHGLTCHAAAQEDLLSRMAALGVGQGTQVAENTLVGVFPDGAGVHYHHVRTLGFLADAVACLTQHTPDPLRIRLVLLTAVGLHIGHRGPTGLPPNSGDPVTIVKLLLQLFI